MSIETSMTHLPNSTTTNGTQLNTNQFHSPKQQPNQSPCKLNSSNVTFHSNKLMSSNEKTKPSITHSDKFVISKNFKFYFIINT